MKSFLSVTKSVVVIFRDGLSNTLLTTGEGASWRLFISRENRGRHESSYKVKWPKNSRFSTPVMNGARVFLSGPENAAHLIVNRSVRVYRRHSICFSKMRENDSLRYEWYWIDLASFDLCAEQKIVRRGSDDSREDARSEG